MNKKFLAVVLAAIMVFATFAFAGCGGTPEAKPETDLDYVKAKGTLVVGVTDFAPMDYKEKGSDEWIGFDADLAKKFAEYLGVKAEIVLIEWENKTLELDSKNIDCVWNGMTLTDDVMAAMACSKPYCNNAQVIVVPADEAEKYATAEACKDLKFAVEKGSAGEAMAKENKFDYTPVLDQATALQEVSAGTSQAAIIDSLMAAAMVGENTGFSALTYTASLNSEEYGVGFRKESNLVGEINAFFDKCASDGTLDTIAEQYGVQAALIK